MKLIISPAKKMNIRTDDLPARELPQFLNKTRILCQAIKALSFSEAKALWNCNDKLAKLNFERFRHMDLESALTPALLSYEGLQYQHMAPAVFTQNALAYVQEHLRILSGFYGVLRPLDRVTPYRLEMQAALTVKGFRDLYAFWGDSCYQALLDEDQTILNLASKEYSRAVEPYVQPEDQFLTVIFGERIRGKICQKGTLAKMARGEMVRYMAERQILKLSELKDFQELGFAFSKEDSTKHEWVFLRTSPE
ncbi:MAG: peroxide stress protein YaaA [Lachnospiraceae bacterium]|jgi:cytoplasmic iron level regulating protein YaaA (DUF328/UPF0246 family)|nr:peroxide stress protein YaaA [Lachnospiraceae bacterium]MCI9132878.1 peroxide stress protein YaaA [Lachnospiraceae bacterium]